MSPLVTAIMPTRGRRDFAAKALACFRAQTYEPKELVIIDDEDDPSFAALPAETVYHCIPGRATIGAKRNMACAAASGDFIAHFDSDDWSAPGRLADQIARLQQTGQAVTGYHSMRFTGAGKWWRNINPSRFAFGTSLCYRRDWWKAHPFPSVQLGEDAHFVNAAAREKQLIAVDAGDLMYATNHADNTSERKVVMGAGWEEVEAIPC